MPEQSKYAALAPYYDLFIDWERRLALELPFILETLPENFQGQSCLDIGCGTGRHLERLRQAGLRIEGLEPSPALRVQAERNLPGAEIHPHPMERLGELAGTHGPWDSAFCLGNTLAHLPPERCAEFFTAMAAAVTHGGKAVLHLLGYEQIMKKRPGNLPEKTVEHNGKRYVFSRNYIYLENKIEFALSITIDGKLAGQQRETLYPLDGETLREYLAGAGFTEVGMFGGFDRSREYTSESTNLVCVAAR